MCPGRTGSVAAGAAHLRYIESDGTTREGERGCAYGPDAEVADPQDFQARGRCYRHQFRLIVSPGDAQQMASLRD